MCSSGDVNAFQWNREWFFSRRVKFDTGFNVMAVFEVSWHGPKIIHSFTGIRKWVLRLWKRPFWFSKKISLTFSSNWVIPWQGGCSQFLISFNKFYSSNCDWNNEFSVFFGKYYFLRIESFLSKSRMRPSFPTPQCLQPLCHLPKFLPRTERIQGTIQVRLSKLMDSWLVFRRDRMLLNQWTKWNNRSFNRLPKTSFTGRLPIR